MTSVTENITNVDAPEAPYQLTEAQLTARKKRNVAIGFGLLAYVILIFAVSVVRLGGGFMVDSAQEFKERAATSEPGIFPPRGH